MVVYMSSSFWLWAAESHVLSQAEKEITACKADQIHKITTIFTQSNNHFECHIVNSLTLAHNSFFLSLR